MPAISSANAQWVDLYAVASITVGSGLLVQNQAGALALLQQATAAPDPSDNTGRWVQPGEEVQVDAGTLRVYMRCSPSGVRAYVQSM